MQGGYVVICRRYPGIDVVICRGCSAEQILLLFVNDMPKSLLVIFLRRQFFVTARTCDMGQLIQLEKIFVRGILAGPLFQDADLDRNIDLVLHRAQFASAALPDRLQRGEAVAMVIGVVGKADQDDSQNRIFQTGIFAVPDTVHNII